MSTAPRTEGGFGEVNHPHYGRLGPYLLHLFYPCLPMGKLFVQLLGSEWEQYSRFIIFGGGSQPLLRQSDVALRVWTSRSRSAGVRWATVCQSQGDFLSSISRNAAVLRWVIVSPGLSITSRLLGHVRHGSSTTSRKVIIEFSSRRLFRVHSMRSAK
jgi:hypothetical protein